ncbi:hypothetical protein [Streptomyces sp. NPDC005244]|uniref:hypothetical protein n=1 Tax=Streptomyces sp. NPDC005244 TaxID=3364708 RepID=UPI0036B5FC3E
MTEKLNPAALAERYEERGADPADIRDGVQPVDEDMIRRYVVEAGHLPMESAGPFADWLDGVFDEYVEDGNDKQTNGEVVSGALKYWRGQ